MENRFVIQSIYLLEMLWRNADCQPTLKLEKCLQTFSEHEFEIQHIELRTSEFIDHEKS